MFQLILCPDNDRKKRVTRCVPGYAVGPVGDICDDMWTPPRCDICDAVVGMPPCGKKLCAGPGPGCVELGEKPVGPPGGCVDVGELRFVMSGFISGGDGILDDMELTEGIGLSMDSIESAIHKEERC